MNAIRSVKALLADLRANVAMTFALCGAVLATAVGGAMDFSRAVEIGTELQSALDSGVLAAASLSQTRDPDTVVRAYVEAAIGDHADVLATLSLDVDATISLNARNVRAAATVDMPTTLLGLIGMNAITVRRTSEAVEQVRNLEISLVLDISGSMSGSKIQALRDAAQEFVQVMFASDAGNRTSISVIPYNGGVRTPGLVNNYLSRSVIFGGFGRWQSGCLEMYLRHDGTPNTYRTGESTVTSIEQYRFGLDWQRHYGEQTFGSVSSNYCPAADQEAIFLSSDEERLLALIGRLRAGGNTGLDIATAWGARALDPFWRYKLPGDFPQRPAPYSDEDTLKIMVVMTDGAATQQRRYDRQGGSHITTTLYSAAQARTYMSTACTTAKSRGVQVFTIAFQVRGGVNQDLMRNCASTADQYFQVESMDIDQAFSSIAADINQLRLSR